MSSMEVFVGIDLGSTTTKSVVLDAKGGVLGRGITNSRSNYTVACKVAQEEAFIRTRFVLLHRELAAGNGDSTANELALEDLERQFRLQQHLALLERLRGFLHWAAETPRHDPYRGEMEAILDEIVDEMIQRAPLLFEPGAHRKSDFFRDLAGAEYMKLAEDRGSPRGLTFEVLCSLYDAAILPVENMGDEGGFAEHIGSALDRTLERHGEIGHGSRFENSVRRIADLELIERNSVGTGYGRQRLPFEKEQIRSEILCHGLGAHTMFEGTATVLDIGGQDTKAIQVDETGIVTSFQMNDRCAAGCGRYLGYIADEMNLGLHELGPLALQARRKVKINSTCTVFAGAELRDRLSMGQNREDILAGLHRAIILRAMSLLARSGGIENEFTFTGGVARNPAAVQALSQLVEENYGHRTLNISPDSIYTGALGAAIFALRDVTEAQSAVQEAR
jgi:benzoyl-CoA reductase subunit A